MQVVSHDTLTGTEIVRLTSERSVQHHLTGPSVTPDGRWLVFLTHETGWPNLAAMDLGSGDVRILTLRRDLNSASATLTIDGLAVLFSARDAVWAVTIADGTETELADFSGARVRHLAASPDGRSVAACLSEGTWHRVVEIDLFDGNVRALAENDRGMGRIQYDPGGQLVLVAGEGEDRLLAVDRARGAPPRVLVPQREGEWILPGAWLPEGRLAFVRFHDGLFVRSSTAPEAGDGCVFKGPIWHVAARSDGGLLVCDTLAPDLGIVLVSPGTGEWRVLCHPRSSNRGTQWTEPLPATGEDEEASGFCRPGVPPSPAETAYGPHWTHPRPVFHPDGGSVFYTSDSSGVAQVYRAFI